MKHPKKRWAWTAQQKGRISLYRSWEYKWQQPTPWFIHHRWKVHRSQTREALHQILRGVDNTQVHFPYHHKHNGHWDWL